MKTISFNGSERQTSADTMAEFLSELRFDPEQVVVELNRSIVTETSVRLSEGDRVTVLPIIAGGMTAGDTVLDLIGNTPMVSLRSGPREATILAKVESTNPGGSVKDRIALGMITAAEQAGELRPGMTIIEPTSGNTGIGLAIVGAVRGYRVQLIMPDSMSVERQAILRYLGAEVILSPGAEGMSGAVRECERRLKSEPEMFCPRQFDNPANPATHMQTTAEEIWTQTGGRIDALVLGIGTGGTITGVARALGPRLPGLMVVGVEPERSPVLSGGQPGRHQIQGIGAGFIPSVLERDLLSEVLSISDDEALSTSRELARSEGLFVGVSSGAAVAGARRIARRLGAGKTVVTLLPDTGERYLSLELPTCNC